MTFFVKCDSCGLMEEAPCNPSGEPYNPTGWYSRLKNGKEVHACQRFHIPKDEGVWPV